MAIDRREFEALRFGSVSNLCDLQFGNDSAS